MRKSVVQILQTVVPILFLCSAGNALALTGKEKVVRARDYQCQDLQQMLAHEKALYVTTGHRGWGVVHKYYASDCGTQYASPANVTTADMRFCRAGYVCVKY